MARLWQDLQAPTAWLEAGLLLSCLGLAWLLVRQWGGRQAQPSSIWFGRRTVDGILFPVTALLLLLGARWWLVLEGVPLAVFHIATPVLVSLVVIRFTVKVLGAAFPRSPLVRIIERTVSWLAWLATILWVTGLLPLLADELAGITWVIGGSTVSVLSIIQGAITAVIVMIMSLSVASAIESRLLSTARGDTSVRKILSNLIRALLLFVGLVVAMSAVGINLTALSVLGGAFGVGLGLGLQKLAANYVSGFVILAERSLHIGDLIKVDGFEGHIIDIKTRYSVIRATNGRESIVPNEMLVVQRVENASRVSARACGQATQLQVAYGTDLDALRPALLAAVSQVPSVLATPQPTVHLTDFVADGLALTLNYQVADVAGQAAVRSEVNLAILAALQGLGVAMAIPQRVVHHLSSPEVSCPDPGPSPDRPSTSTAA